jgi:hypothetical protein
VVSLDSLFLNPAGLTTALVLIPFLILYLIRPKPKRETIPSLLFIMKDLGRSNINSLFRSLLKDLLLILQLLILVALIAAVAEPYVNVPRSYLVEQTVLLVDVSGSMRASGDARFHDAVAAAERNLGKQNTIILVKADPEVVAERVSAGKAREVLNGLEPTETTTALTDALHLATEYATTGSRIVVISDFLPTAGDLDYNTAADALEALGAIVEYIPITSPAQNVGIIDLAVGPVTSTLWLKNYDARPEQVTLRISDAEQQVLLAKGETKEVQFKTPAGVAEASIKEGDDLLADNTVWMSTPAKNSVKVLVITNDQRSVDQSNLRLALSVISKNFPTTFDIEYAIPPKIPDLQHDVYILYNANIDFILPGYVKGIKDQVQAGAAFIAFQQPTLFALDWQGLLPVQPANDTQGGRATLTSPETTTLTQDIEFGQVGSYFRVTATPGASIVTAADNNDPLIVLDRRGKGHVLYYGLDDTKASFSKDPSYPVFWRRTFDLLTNRPSLENLNLKTGGILALQGVTTVKTPSGTVTASMLPLDRAGLYTLPDRVVAVNMLSDGESNIAPPNVSTTQRAEGAAQTEKAPEDLSDTMLWLGLAFVLLELLYIKYRGDF